MNLSVDSREVIEADCRQNHPRYELCERHFMRDFAECIAKKLVGEKYEVAGKYTLGGQDASVLLEGFSIDVAALFASADGIVQ